MRVWRALAGGSPGVDPQVLSAQRRTRLVLALRALDGRLDHASYREIAEELFGRWRWMVMRTGTRTPSATAPFGWRASAAS
jgi:hypothetical protein